VVHGLTPGEIYWVVTNGIKASEMPAFHTKMDEQERWQTVLYVQHLRGEHQHGDHTMSDKSPNRTSVHAEHNLASMLTTITGGPFRSMRALSFFGAYRG
jgi:hypothetical protein